MKPHCKIAWIQAVHYASIHGGCLIELKQYGYTECSNGVNIYWNRTVGKCFLFADNIMTIYDSLEVGYEKQNSKPKAGLSREVLKKTVEIWSQFCTVRS
jgi:hypothetical protein